MKLERIHLVSCFLTALFLFFIHDAITAQEINYDLTELVGRSTLIIYGKVTNAESRWVEDHRGKHIYTYASIKIYEVIKGHLTDNNIKLEILGGKVGSITEYVTNSSFSVEPNEEIILFLDAATMLPIGGQTGKYSVIDGMVYDSCKSLKVDKFIYKILKLLEDPNYLPENEKIEQGINDSKEQGQLIEKVIIKDGKITRRDMVDPAAVKVKGEFGNQTLEPASEMLAVNDKQISYEDKTLGKEKFDKEILLNFSPSGWQTIMNETFESAFPSTGWNVFVQTGYIDAYWDDQSYRAYAGSRSAWCAAAGTQAGTLGGNYPNNMKTWMKYGPFSLSDASDAKVDFYYWNKSESNYDYFKWMVSIDGENFYGYIASGNSNGWVAQTFDLKNVYILGNICGSSQVWVAFIFQSDASYTYEGAFVDNISVQKYTTGTPQPNLVWTTLSLSSDQWSVGNSITANLTEQNSGTAAADSHQTQLYLSADNIITTSDIQLGAPISFTSIAAGATQTQPKTFTVPAVSDGTYWMGAIVDIYNSVIESDEANNGGTRTGTVTVTNPLTAPSITSITPDKASAGTNSTVTITGTNFGSTQGTGKVEFFYKSNSPKISAPISTWSNTQIVCSVPTATISGYPASASSGPVTVTNNSGSTSNQFPFKIKFGYGGVKRLGSNPIVNYKINENTSDCDGEGIAVQNATTSWNNSGAAFRFNYSGTHTNTVTSSNGVNEIIWGSASGSIAIANIWYTDSTILETDIMFNDPDYLWSTGTSPTSSQMDVQTIATHELGHWLNLRDIYGDIGDNEYDKGKAMYGFGSAGQSKRNLHSDDIDGIKWIYGVTSCSLSVSKTFSDPIPAAGGTFANSLNITVTGSSCGSWSITSPSWVTVTPSSGSGSQQCTVAVQQNTGAARSGNIQVTLSGAAGSPYTLTINQTTTSGIPLLPVTSNDTPNIGTEIWLDIQVGDQSQPVTNLKIISFDLLYSNTQIIDYVTDEVGTFLTNASKIVVPDDPSGKISASVYRMSGGNSGFGTVLRVKFAISNTATNGQQVTFSFQNILANDVDGNTISLQPSTKTITIQASVVVWPGDANNNGSVEITDINYVVAIHWGRTGPARSNASMNWVAQNCSPWSPANATYSDCNGNGSVEITDINSIIVNFGRTHSTNSRPTQYTLNDPPIACIAPSSVTASQEFWVDINVGSSIIPVTDLKVVSFELRYTNTNVLQFLEYQVGNFLTNASAIVVPDSVNGKISISVYKLTGGNSGYGNLLRLKFKVADNLPLPYPTIVYSFENVLANKADGTNHPLNPLGSSVATPVELTSFNSNFSKNVITLSWSTATEINNHGFEIERSINNSNWEKLSFVTGYGTTTEPKDYTFIDKNISKQGIYNYRLKQVDHDGKYSYSRTISIEVNLIPFEYILSQNYPNPFNPSTKISYSIPVASIVTLKVFDAIGNEVATLVHEQKEAGFYEVNFEAKNLSNGVYFYELLANEFREVKKLILLK